MLFVSKIFKTWLLGCLTLFFSTPPLSISGHGYRDKSIGTRNENLCKRTPNSICGCGYIGGSIGPSNGNLSKRTPKIAYTSGVVITDAYPLDHKDSWSVTLNADGGYEFAGANWKPAVALGLDIYFNPQDYRFKGKVIETSAGDPSSTLLKYSYRLKNSTRLMTEAQLTWIVQYVCPFINFGIGPAWIKADNYKETGIDSTSYSPLPPFHSKWNLNFAYQAGIGISIPFNLKCSKSRFLPERISIGYHYVNMGKTSFGREAPLIRIALRSARGYPMIYILHTRTYFKKKKENHVNFQQRKLFIMIIIPFFPLMIRAHLISITTPTPFPSSMTEYSITTAIFTVTNITSGAIVTPINQSNFSDTGITILSSTLGTPLAPGESATITLQIQPTSTAAISTALKVWAKPTADGVKVPINVTVTPVPTYDAIVIGAGMAGLEAASILQENNMNVLILEARNRIGGRIETTTMGNAWTDLGATWLHDINNNVLADLANEYGIPLIDTIYNQNNIVLFNGNTQINDPDIFNYFPYYIRL